MDDLLRRCAALDGAAWGEGAFAPGPAVWVGKREVAHADGPGTLDVRLTREVIRARRDELRADGRVTLRRAGSDWVEVRVESAADEEFALGLVAEAVAANALDAPPGPPPTGADLARRRRFH